MDTKFYCADKENRLMPDVWMIQEHKKVISEGINEKFLVI